MFASTAIDTGPPCSASTSASSVLSTSVKPLGYTFASDLLYWHVPSEPLYEYVDSSSEPAPMSYVNASSIRPPLQPWSTLRSQSTSCCSDSFSRFWVLSAQRASSEPIVEKAQHEPHEPWFCTAFSTLGVWERQSSVAGAADPDALNSSRASAGRVCLKPPLSVMNSSKGMSAHSLISKRRSRPSLRLRLLACATYLWLASKV